VQALKSNKLLDDKTAQIRLSDMLWPPIRLDKDKGQASTSAPYER
jgi:hypothetical protein